MKVVLAMSEEHKPVDVDDVPVVEVPRGKRNKIDHSEPGHRCSPNHVRVPAHCRLKRGKKTKKKTKFITERKEPKKTFFESHPYP